MLSVPVLYHFGRENARQIRLGIGQARGSGEEQREQQFILHGQVS